MLSFTEDPRARSAIFSRSLHDRSHLIGYSLKISDAYWLRNPRPHPNDNFNNNLYISNKLRAGKVYVRILDILASGTGLWSFLR